MIKAWAMSMIVWQTLSETPFCSWEYDADGLKIISSFNIHFLIYLF